MTQISSPKHKTWHPIKPPSIGAVAYHNAVINTSWHKTNLKKLIDILGRKIKKNDIIVDFGAGTGSSAFYLLKHLENNFKLLLVDNSPSWLGNAYELFKHKSNVEFYILEKLQDTYITLEKVIGKEVAHHVLSTNTVHLIPQLHEVFNGIYAALKPRGTFTFQSGSIIRNDRHKDILIIDNTINNVHDIAIDIIKTNDKFSKYRKGLKERIKKEIFQRKFVFPDPRPTEHYLDALKKAGFKNADISYKNIKVSYKDWQNFLLVKRIQAGILPEVGGKEASPEEEKDRNTLIKMATNQLFKHLEKNNAFSNKTSFTSEWIYITGEK